MYLRGIGKDSCRGKNRMSYILFQLILLNLYMSRLRILNQCVGNLLDYFFHIFLQTANTGLSAVGINELINDIWSQCEFCL